MLLREAQQILRKNGYRLIKEFRAMDSDNNVIEDPDLKDMDFDYNEDDYKSVNEVITVDYIGKSNYKDYIGKTVNVKGDVTLILLGLAKLPIKFNKVGGDFWCSNNNLTSLEGCPKTVGGGFYCGGNKLTSLKGCPETVGGNFSCVGNNLTSLKGCPESVGGYFDCSDNKLASLKGCPKSVGRKFLCGLNKVKFTKEEVEELCDVVGDKL